jgi:hypothetical protein
MFNHGYKLEHVCSLKFVRAGSDFIGQTPTGFRMYGYLAGGEVTGPKINGKVRPLGGGDWGILRDDDIIDINARIVIETHDGAMIDTTYTGVVMLPEHGTERVKQGKLTVKCPLRTVPRMVTAHPAYAWANRTQFIGIGVIDFAEKIEAVTYDYYALG